MYNEDDSFEKRKDNCFTEVHKKNMKTLGIDNRTWTQEGRGLKSEDCKF
jgi:hypothetical protein